MTIGEGRRLRWNNVPLTILSKVKLVSINWNRPCDQNIPTKQTPAWILHLFCFFSISNISKTWSSPQMLKHELRQFGLTCPSLPNYQGIFKDRTVDHWESRFKKMKPLETHVYRFRPSGPPLWLESLSPLKKRTAILSPLAPVWGRLSFGLIPVPWALTVFCARLRTKSKGHFSRYYKSAVKTRQRILLFVGLLVSSFLPLLVFSYLSPNLFPIQKGGTQG